MRGAAARHALLSRACSTPGPVAHLRELAGLVDDALVALGAEPAFAEAAGGTARPRMPMRARPAGGSVRDASTVGDADGAGGTDGLSDTPSDGAIADDHVETWRLVQQAQGGDGDAFGELYDRYVDMVYRFVYYRVNDRGLAEDFTSETFLRALRRINSISYQGRDIGAWFVTIARNIVLDHVKSARHRLETTTGETIESTEHEQSTENAVLTSLQNERLMAAVAQLGDEQRECVVLRFVQGMSVNETATIMGKNDGAIKALQHRAVRKLADLVGGDPR